MTPRCGLSVIRYPSFNERGEAKEALQKSIIETCDLARASENEEKEGEKSYKLFFT